MVTSSQGSQSSHTQAPERLAISEVRLQDFRGFDDCCVMLGERALLVGENNSGKSSFLHSLAISLGGAQAREDDFRVVAGVTKPEFVIDVRVEPAGTATTFETSLVQLLTTAIQPAKPGGKQFFTIRCRGVLDTVEGPNVRRCFLRGWAHDRATASTLQELASPFISQKHRDLITFTVLDARRDIVSELRNRRTYWGRLLADLQLPAQSRSKLEADLRVLGETLVQQSARLIDIQTTLRSISSVIARPDAGVHIVAIPSNIDDLVRYIDILIGEKSQDALPVQQQGMGTRSLLALILFEAFVAEVLKMSSTYTLPVTAIEEPEAHVHPHVQRALLPQLHKLRGQLLVSTHSPYVASVADIFTVRVFRADKTGNSVRWLKRFDASGQPRIDNNGVSALQRFIQRRNGDLFFSRVVALFEGDTEDAAMPVFATAALGVDPNAAGLSLVNVGGSGNYKHFLPLLEDLGIPWFIISDADKGGLDGLAAAGKTLGRKLDASSPEVVCFDAGNDFEAQIIAEGLRPEAETAITQFYGPMALSDFKAQLHGTKASGGVVRDYTSPGWEDRLVKDFLDRNKGSFGAAFAEAVVATGKQMIHTALFFAKIKPHL